MNEKLDISCSRVQIKKPKNEEIACGEARGGNAAR